MTTALAAVDDDGIATLTNLTAPLDFHDDGMLASWTKAPFFDPRAVTDALGHVPAWLSQPSFMVLRPMGTPVKALRLFQKLGDERFVTFFRALETWINDNVAIPRLFYLDLIERLYRDNALFEGTLRLGDDPAVLEEVRVPALTICAEEDHIVPPRSAVRGHERLGSDEKELSVFAGGHIGVVIGSKAKRELWPRMMSWFERHDERARVEVAS
jgi:polyhydroxyalkanoate synthase